MNQYTATLRWTPPSVDLEEEEQTILVHGGEPSTIRRVLEIKIKQIGASTGWACDLTLVPRMTLCHPKN